MRLGSLSTKSKRISYFSINSQFSSVLYSLVQGKVKSSMNFCIGFLSVVSLWAYLFPLLCIPSSEHIPEQISYERSRWVSAKTQKYWRPKSRCFLSYLRKFNGKNGDVFSHSFSMQKQPPELFCKNRVLKNFTVFAGKHLC